MPTNRRDFLALAAAGAASALVPPTPARAAAPAPPAADDYDGALCVFSKHLQFLDYDAMAEAVADIGFDGVDLTVRRGGHVLPENVERDLPRAVEAVRKAGLVVPMMATNVNDAEDPLTRPVLETAAALGIPYYRMAYLGYADDQNPAASLAALRSQVRDLAALNAALGIHGGYQNHDGTRVGAPVWDLHLLFQGLDPAAIGVQYDVRHATVEGGNAWPLGMRLVAPYIRTMVVKDFRWGEQGGRWRVVNTPLGEGMVDFDRWVELRRALGLRGPISIHYEYDIPESRDRLDETKAQMRRDLEFIRARLG